MTESSVVSKVGNDKKDDNAYRKRNQLELFQQMLMQGKNRKIHKISQIVPNSDKAEKPQSKYTLETDVEKLC